MKRTIINIAVWLLVGVLFLVLQHVLRAPVRTVPPGQGTAQQEPVFISSDMSGLMAEKQRLEQELKALDQEIAAAKAAPSSVMILLSTPDEQTVSGVAQILDPAGVPALLGVNAASLELWAVSGVPQWVSERLDSGWELCLILENKSAAGMQEMLSALGLPAAKAAFRFGLAPVTPQDGVVLMLEDGARYAASEDVQLQIPAIGNMNRSGLEMYRAAQNNGSAIAFIVGDLRADQRYEPLNLEALAELLAEDIARGYMQCPGVEGVLSAHRAYEAQVTPEMEAQWSSRRMTIDAQLDAVNKRITAIPSN